MEATNEEIQETLQDQAQTEADGFIDSQMMEAMLQETFSEPNQTSRLFPSAKLQMALHEILEDTVQRFTSEWESYLQEKVRLQTKVAQVRTFQELQDAMGYPAYYSVLQVEPYHSWWVFHLDRSLVEGVVPIGNSSVQTSAPDPRKYLKLGPLLLECFRHMIASWHSIVELSTKSVAHMARLTDLNVAAAEDLFVCQILEVQGEKASGKITIGLPYAFLLNVFPENASLEERSEVKIVLGSTQISEETLNAFREGQHLGLEQGPSDPVQVMTPEGITFLGKLGQLRQHYAIKLKEQ